MIREKEKKAEYSEMSEDYFQDMFLRIRLNTIDGYPDSKLFYQQLMPKGFHPRRHEFNPSWFRTCMSIFGFGLADRVQRALIS